MAVLKTAIFSSYAQCSTAFRDFPQDICGSGESETGCHADARSESGAVQSNRSHSSGHRFFRAARFASVLRRGFGVDQRLVGIDRTHLELRFWPTRKAVQFAQLPAHLREQRVLDRERQIIDTNPRRIQLPTRPANGDHWLSMLNTPRN